MLPLATPERWIDVVETPAVLIDLDVVERNIAKGQQRCDSLGYKLRPHIKTHKLPMLARAQLQAGAVGVTAQKIGEAQVMADAGVGDILITFNIVGPRKLERLRKLAAKTRLSVTADNVAVVEGLAGAFTDEADPLTVLVECDTGMNRCGVTSPEEAAQLAQAIASASGLRFGGLLTYPAVGRSDEAADWLDEARASCVAVGLDVPEVSSGGTPDFYRLKSDPRLTEYRPGVYIYNDRSLVASGACSVEDCALTVAATIVSVPSLDRGAVDAGSKTLTSDLFGLEGHGLVVGRPDISIPRLSEEHGHLALSGEGDALAVGDVLRIVPNHACVVSNMFDHVHLVRGEFYVGKEAVAARGTVS
jgi:D-serine deaminase-like pyridoxal phosphate-dependent protein